MYSSTHFGISNLDGILKNLFGEEHDDDEEFEFLRRQSTVVSLQNSTHVGVLVLEPKPTSKLCREKFEDDPTDFSLTNLCFLRIYGSVTDFRNVVS
ncbi:hypothetical protein C1H46_000208 [Malus baccata]|uniref:Uncharacterized protein n=1 Tax=Malus baccata TaxID=106549 RepID=A0A540NTE5_MALBA|nr:hypothetical protein C1H46_000208 [Malus baccata]